MIRLFFAFFLVSRSRTDCYRKKDSDEHSSSLTIHVVCLKKNWEFWRNQMKNSIPINKEVDFFEKKSVRSLIWMGW